MKLSHYLMPIAALTLLNACTESSAAPALSGQAPAIDSRMAETLAKSEIIQLAHSYGIARDNYDGQAYASVFAEDGVFVFRGEEYKGREAIAARVPAKDENSGISMHFVTTSSVELTSPTTASGMHYGIVYVGNYEEGAERTGSVPGRLGSRGVYVDNYVLTNEGWKISRRAYKSIFSQPKP